MCLGRSLIDARSPFRCSVHRLISSSSVDTDETVCEHARATDTLSVYICRRPGSGHHVMWPDGSSFWPQLGHLFKTEGSYRDSCRLVPQNLEVCLVTKTWNIRGNSFITALDPPHQALSKCVRSIMCLLWTSSLATPLPQCSLICWSTSPVALVPPTRVLETLIFYFFNYKSALFFEGKRS